MWSNKQKNDVHKYVRLAKLTEAEYRTLLHQVTGRSSSADPQLTATDDFGLFMASIEAALDWRHQEGLCPCPWSDRVQRTYWRERLTDNGKRIVTHKVYDLWAELKTMLPQDARDTSYLLGIAGQAVRRNTVADIANLPIWQQLTVIEALKARIFQTRRTHATDRAGLPGANAVPDHAQEDTQDGLPDSADPDENCEVGVQEPIGVPF
jgi:hypothetical protein